MGAHASSPSHEGAVATADRGPDRGEDETPSSRVRPLEREPAPRWLVVVTPLRGGLAESAWLTVADDEGVVHFEGPLLPDGRVTVLVAGISPAIVVRLETPQRHRQAQIALPEGTSVYRFG
ncbi:MAG: hypothetical protein ABSC94_16915 [Polyangiaceae bacterium]|jgi:hypothetical protein